MKTLPATGTGFLRSRLRSLSAGLYLRSMPNKGAAVIIDTANCAEQGD